MDVFSPAKRSQVMARIRSRGNIRTELRLIKVARLHKITGWRRNQKLFGSPDFTFRKARLVVFVDGCFWHGCPRCYQRPKSNQDYWDKKVFRNRERDQQVAANLKQRGWRVLRIWEHELRTPKRVATKIVTALTRSIIQKTSASAKNASHGRQPILRQQRKIGLQRKSQMLLKQQRQ
jgi:DNA mismatch endonuclease, patch repair protein